MYIVIYLTLNFKMFFSNFATNYQFKIFVIYTSEADLIQWPLNAYFHEVCHQLNSFLSIQSRITNEIKYEV